MPSERRRALLALMAGASLAGVGGPARAAWPDKPVRLVVPYGGGGMGTVFANM